MDQTAKVVELLKSHRKPQGNIFFFAKVIKVDGNTCTVMYGELELARVRLKATDKDEDQFLITPKIGSTVLVGANNGDLREIFVARVDDPSIILYKHDDLKILIDGEAGKVTINGGDLGGLIKIAELINRFNAIEDFVTQFRIAFDTHTHASAPAISPTPAPPFVLFNQDPEKTQRDSLEDTKVTH